MKGYKARLVGEDFEKKLDVTKRLQALPLNKKIDMALEIIDRSKKHLEPAEKVCCCFSGGKDSVTVLSLLCRAFKRSEIICNYNPVQYMAPGRLEKIARFAAKEGVEFVATKPIDTFELWKKKQCFPIFSKRLYDGQAKKLIKEQGLKVSGNQCCYHHKEAPFIQFLKEYHLKVTYWGVRLSESGLRFFWGIHSPTIVHSTRQRFNVYPIFFWTVEDVREYLRKNCPWFEGHKTVYNDDCLFCAVDILSFPNNLYRLLQTDRELFSKAMRAGMGEQILKANRKDPNQLEYFLANDPIQLCKIDGLTHRRRQES